MMRKSVWSQFPFSDTIIGNDDIEWALRVKAAGYKIVYEPEALIYHSHTPSMKEIYRRMHEEFVSFAQIDESVKRNWLIFLLAPLRQIFLDWVFILKHRKPVFYTLYSIPYRYAEAKGKLDGYRDGLRKRTAQQKSQHQGSHENRAGL